MSSATCACTYPDAGGSIVLCAWHKQEFEALRQRELTQDIAEYAGAMRAIAEFGLDLVKGAEVFAAQYGSRTAGYRKSVKQHREYMEKMLERAYALNPRRKS